MSTWLFILQIVLMILGCVIWQLDAFFIASYEKDTPVVVWPMIFVQRNVSLWYPQNYCFDQFEANASSKIWTCFLPCHNTTYRNYSQAGYEILVFDRNQSFCWLPSSSTEHVLSFALSLIPKLTFLLRLLLPLNLFLLLNYE